MDNLYSNPTNKTPKVILDERGKLLIEGRSLPEKAAKFYIPIILWLKHLETKKLLVEINVEYLNTASLKWFRSIFNQISVNDEIKQKTIHWYIDREDEEMQEYSNSISKEFTNIVFCFMPAESKNKDNAE